MRQRPTCESDEQLLIRQVTDQLSLALEMRLFQETQHALAETDPCTEPAPN
jgi:hypothetical protein